MLKNADITVINHWTDKDGDHYITAYISGVWWHGGTLKSVGDKGLESAASYKISIYKTSEQEKPYLPYSSWANLEDKREAWTLHPGDYIAKGRVSGSITRPPDFLSQYECAEVIGVKDLRFGSNPYIRVEGK